MGEKCYKAFEKGLVCRGKQYTENTVFEEESAKICKKGMHYCKNPFDVLDYYPLVNEDGSFNEFAEVEPLAEEHTDDSKKFCTSKLRIGAKLSFSGFIKACVDFVIEKTKYEGTEGKESGNFAQIGASGNFAKIGSSGNAAQIGASGNFAQIGASGNFAQIGSSGDSAKIGASGNFAQIGASGDSAQIGASGNFAKIGASGNFAKIGASGDSAKIGASGDSAKIGASGDSAKIDSNGKYAVVMCAGNNSMAKAKIGSFITLAEWKYSEKEEMAIPINVKTCKVDGINIKEDTFYKLIDGEFVEVE